MKEIPLGLPSLTTPSKSGSTLSVEVYSIQQDGSSTLLSDAEEGTFFDTELLAVIHRHKLGAVAATDLFLWHGKQAQVDRKASEEANALARRYRADIVSICLSRTLLLLILVVARLKYIKATSKRHVWPTFSITE